MSKEKMAELKIKIPARWLNFINEYHEVAGLDFDENMQDTIKAAIEGWMIPELSAKDTIRLVEKYRLTDLYEISQRDRDEAAGDTTFVITATPGKEHKTTPEFKQALKDVLSEPEFQKTIDSAIDDSVKKQIRELYDTDPEFKERVDNYLKFPAVVPGA
jgi:hypothetical protein